MRWDFKNYYIELGSFDYDLKTFDFFTYSHDELIGKIYPPDIEAMNYLISELNLGVDPIEDSWEDGRGEIVNINGWGEFQ